MGVPERRKKVTEKILKTMITEFQVSQTPSYRAGKLREHQVGEMPIKLHQGESY